MLLLTRTSHGELGTLPQESGVVRNLKIWKSKDNSNETKALLVLVCRTYILLYNAATGFSHKRSLRLFEMSVARKMLGCTRIEHGRNADILKELSLKHDIGEILISRRPWSVILKLQQASTHAARWSYWRHPPKRKTTE